MLEQEAGDPKIDFLIGDNINFDGVDDDLKRFQSNPIVRQALEKDIDLTSYANQIEVDLKGVEIESIKDYVDASLDLSDLHGQIRGCDEILEKMQSILSGFQNNLSAISSDIRVLENESRNLSVQLANRKTAESQLGKLIESLAVEDTLVDKIQTATINKEYLEGPLVALNGKLQFSQSVEDQSMKSIRDVLPILRTLTNTAVQRIRGFLLSKIHDLKTPGTNIALKQQLLLEYKYFQIFLKEHGTQCAVEVRNSYVQTQATVYQGNFRNYLNSMKKLSAKRVPKDCLVGSSNDGPTSFFAVRRDPAEVTRFLSLRNRHQLLNKLNGVPIVTHVAQKDGTRYNPEVQYWSISRLLMDTVTSEYVFCLKFFNDGNLFKHIFDKTLQLFTTWINDMLSVSYDVIGLLLMIRILQEHKEEMIKRRCPCLEPFFNRTFMDFYPRFKRLLDLHLESVRNLRTRPDPPNQTENKDSGAPHLAIQRYAILVSAILVLNKDKPDQQISTILERFRVEIGKLLTTLAKKKSKRVQTVFLINNHDVILTTLRTSNATESDEFKTFSELQQAQMDRYVETELSVDFSGLIGFLKTSEQHVSTPAKISQDKMKATAKAFVGKWEQALQRINATVAHNFTPNVSAAVAESIGPEELLRNCKELLRKILLQLLVYFQRFIRVVKASGNSRLEQDMLALKDKLKYEIRRLVAEPGNA